MSEISTILAGLTFDLAWWSDEGTKKLKRLRRRFGLKGVPENRNERGQDRD
jgi:hypothetical protein